MSTPSLLNVPYRLKAGTLYSQIPETGLGDFAVTRSASNVATRINSLGFIETVADNVPRLDYPLGGAVNGCPALLVEPSAINSLFHSEAFDNVYWTKSGTTDQGNVATSPSNTLTADNIYPTVSGLDQRLQRAISIVNGTTYTSSIFAKANGINWIKFFAAQFNAAAFFNVQSGTIGTVQAGVTARIENYGNGWYRCSVTQTVTTTGTGQVYINLTDSNGYSTVTASGTNGVLFWGAQVETGSIATSYIPTTTAAITRGAEVINKTGVSLLIGQTEGTMYWEGDASLVSGASDILFINRNATNSVVLFKGATNLLTARVHASGVTALTIADTVVRTGFLKIAVAYKSGDSTFYINGTRVGTLNTTAFTFTAALNTIRFGDDAFLSGRGDQRCRAVAIYSTRISDAELALLTA